MENLEGEHFEDQGMGGANIKANLINGENVNSIHLVQNGVHLVVLDVTSI